MGAVAGAGIEQAGDAIPRQTVEIDPGEAQVIAQQQPQQRRGNQGADGRKRQRVGEVAVIVQHQQDIVRALDQGVGVRQHAAGHADGRREAALVGRRQGGGQGGAEHAVGYQVHRGTIQSALPVREVHPPRIGGRYSPILTQPED
ncbi:hypothetical protein MTBSS4_90122 [Magnetospirillum sp. SS-4]|nr:hypothetical protein MTBSS4_90122 [Magnetospirillum sp. SS-4]